MRTHHVAAGDLHLDGEDRFAAVLAHWPGGRFLTDAWRAEPALLVRVHMHEYHWFVPAVRSSFPTLVPDAGHQEEYHIITVVPPLVAEILSYVSCDGGMRVLGVDLAGLDPPAARPGGLLAAPELAALDRRCLLEAVDAGLARGGDAMDFDTLVCTLDFVAGIARRAGTDVLSALQFIDDVEYVDLDALESVLTVAYS